MLASICIMPVAVYPKKYLNELREEISDVKAKIASGEQPVFGSVDALFKRLIVQKKKQLKNKLQIFLSAVSTWISALSGITKVTK